MRKFDVSNQQVENYKANIGLTDEDAAEIARFRLAVKAMAPQVVAVFYTDLEKQELYQSLITSQDMQDGMKATMVTYLSSLFSGVYDADYALERYRIGGIHAQMSIPASQLLSSMFNLREQIESRLMATGLLPSIPMGMRKVFLLDTLFIVDAYTHFAATRAS